MAANRNIVIAPEDPRLMRPDEEGEFDPFAALGVLQTAGEVERMMADVEDILPSHPAPVDLRLILDRPPFWH